MEGRRKGSNERRKGDEKEVMREGSNERGEERRKERRRKEIPHI